MIAHPAPSAVFLTPEIQDIAESLLLPNENVIHLASISPFIYWKSVLVAVGAFFALFFSINLAVYFLIISLGLFLMAFSTRKYFLLMATDQRLLIRCGIINLEVIQFGYDAIESIELSSMLLGQIFGYSSVIISGTGKRSIAIPYIENAIIFEDTVTQKSLEKKKTS